MKVYLIDIYGNALGTVNVETVPHKGETIALTEGRYPEIPVPKGARFAVMYASVENDMYTVTVKALNWATLVYMEQIKDKAEEQADA